jgi:sorting nexin-41/42
MIWLTWLSQNEVLHAVPVASIPKNNLKAPPLDPANPTPAHQWLPIPSSSAKLRSASTASSTSSLASPPDQSTPASSAAHSIPGSQVFGRFPPASQNLTEQELDPYFTNFESATKELELLLQGSIERVNRRTLSHLSSLSADLQELGARYNAFSLSEQSPGVAAAIERIGQAVDSSYIATEELSSTLGASFAEPMRESAQFAGVVRSVLRFRILKRIQEEMTRDELQKKRTLLQGLEQSEREARRIEQYLSGAGAPSATVRRSASAASGKTDTASGPQGAHEDTASIDSDFPPTHAEYPSSQPGANGQEPTSPHRKSQSGNFVTNKIFGGIGHAVRGIVDVDPERTRRDQIGKTRESIAHVLAVLHTRPSTG